MGQCQSLPPQTRDVSQKHRSALEGHTETAKSKRSSRKRLTILTRSSTSKASKDSKDDVNTGGDDLFSPSEGTNATHPETPTSMSPISSDTGTGTESSTKKSKSDGSSNSSTDMDDEVNSIAHHSLNPSSNSVLESLQEEDEENDNDSHSSSGAPSPAIKSTVVQVGNHSLALVDFCDLQEALESNTPSPKKSKRQSKRSPVSEESSIGAPSDEESLARGSYRPRRRHSPTGSLISESERSLEPNLKRSSLQKPYKSRKSRSRSSTKPVSAIVPSRGHSAKSQTSIKILRQRITEPSSIIHRQAPSAPTGDGIDSAAADADLPQESVNPHTLSDFNKLKLQVQLANRAEKQKRRKDKIEERHGDIEGYKSLWNDFAEIEKQVRDSDTESVAASVLSTSLSIKKGSGRKVERSNSMGLQDSASWYFDFSMIQQVKPPLDLGVAKGGSIVMNADDDDNRSQSNMSLLSEASMEVQKRLFNNKRRDRRRTKSSGSRRKQTRRPRSRSRGGGGGGGSDDESSVSSYNTSSSRHSRTSAFKGQTEEGDYGPPRRITSFSIMQELDHDSDDATPPRANRLDSDDDNTSQISGYTNEPDSQPEGDYGVVRRRRVRGSARNQHDWDDASSITTFENNINLGAVIVRDLAAIRSRPSVERPVTMEIRKFASQAPMQKYGFDPSAPLSSQIDALSARIENLNVPSVEVKKDGIVQWRNLVSQTSAKADTTKDNANSDSAGPSVEEPSKLQETPRKSNLQSRSQVQQEPQTSSQKLSPSGKDTTETSKNGNKDHFGAPLGSYNPEFAILSSSAFLHMTASPAPPNEKDCDSDGSDDSVVDDFAERLLLAKKRHSSSQIKSPKLNKTKPPFHPLIAGLSTEDFYSISDRYSLPTKEDLEEDKRREARMLAMELADSFISDSSDNERPVEKTAAAPWSNRYSNNSRPSSSIGATSRSTALPTSNHKLSRNSNENISSPHRTIHANEVSIEISDEIASAENNDLLVDTVSNSVEALLDKFRSANSQMANATEDVK